MTRPMPPYNPFDVVVVPFPFTDRQASKRRPALVLSLPAGPPKSPHYLLGMITSARNAAWPLDVPLQDLTAAGLPAASVARMKLFTLDQQLVLSQAGTLTRRDRLAVMRSLHKLLPSMDVT